MVDRERTLIETIQEVLEPDGAPTAQGRQRYKPVVLEVSANSIVNTCVAFEGLEGWWEPPKDLVEGGRWPPPKGTTATWVLQTGPKGSSAKPGAIYTDIITVRPVEEGQVPKETAGISPRRATSAPQTTTGLFPGIFSPGQVDARSLSIEREVVLKAAVEAHGISRDREEIDAVLSSYEYMLKRLPEIHAALSSAQAEPEPEGAGPESHDDDELASLQHPWN